MMQVYSSLARDTVFDGMMQRAAIQAQAFAFSVNMIQHIIKTVRSEQFFGHEPGNPFSATIPKSDRSVKVNDIYALIQFIQ